MIRILHSVSNMDRAGAETMLMNYYRNMDREKVQYDFLCNKTKPGAYDEEILSLGGKIYHTPGLNPLKYGAYLDYMKELFEEHPEYKVLEVHNGPLGVYALHAAKKCGVPVRIFHAHGAKLTRDFKIVLKAFCKSRLAANLTHRFTCGERAAAFYFGKKVADSGDYELIRNAIAVDKFSFSLETRTRMRAAHGLTGKHVVGHVGRFMHEKNHPFLLDTFAKLKEIDDKAYLVLLGDGEFMQDMQEKAKDLGIEDFVYFAGNVSNTDEWYQAFDCFVMPSHSEGLPMVGVEAQAADLPCLFSTGVSREMALLDRAYFLDLSRGEEAWANAILKLLGQAEDRRDRSDDMKAVHYDIATEAKRLQERYIELAGGNQ